MGRCYPHLSLEERGKVDKWREAKMPSPEIADRLGRAPSTIYRELKRNTHEDKELSELNGYYCMTAQAKYERRRAIHRKMIVHPGLKEAIKDRLKAGWSPEQIAGRMRLERHLIRVSHETIYRFAYSKDGRDEQFYRSSSGASLAPPATWLPQAQPDPYPGSEKLEIIRTVEASHLPTRRTLETIGIPSTTYYRWYDLWSEGGVDALEDRAPRPRSLWNRIPDETREVFIEFALEHEDLTPRELAVKYTDEEQCFISESSAYRILKAEDLITAPRHIVIKAANEFKDKTTRPNELWQTDFTYLKVIGWGWFYLSTILDDYSRYIIAWKLCTTMKAQDVTDTLDLALEASGCDCATVATKPRLLSDNGSSYVAGHLAKYLEGKDMDHVRGAPHHPQTHGKIPLGTLLRNALPGAVERWHQTMKNRVLLEHYFLPGDLERQIAAFVNYYNNQRYHESLGNLTPTDVCFGRAEQILKQREEIKRKTMITRRLRHKTENA